MEVINTVGHHHQMCTNILTAVKTAKTMNQTTNYLKFVIHPNGNISLVKIFKTLSPVQPYATEQFGR